MIVDLLLFLLGAASLIVAVALAVELARGQRSVPALPDVTPQPDHAPRVSVIIPARNEERKLERALRSVLSQDYPDLEVIALNDRSTDRTGSILNRLTKEQGRLQVIHIEKLPPDWLGKTHALHTGAQRATGAVLLFTDADVVMEPSVIGRAVSHMRAAGVDHVTVTARLEAPDPVLDLVEGAFLLLVLRLGQPWKCVDPQSDRVTGLGAFSMLRRETYQAIGGHAPIASHPIDDLELGRLVKEGGFRQALLWGKGMITVEWYASLAEMIGGLRKNAFAATGHRLLPLIALTLFVLALDVWPWIALLATGGPTQLLNTMIVLASVLSYADTAPRYGLERWLGLALPVGALILLYSIWGSALTAIASGSVTWRGTRYPLRPVKAALRGWRRKTRPPRSERTEPPPSGQAGEGQDDLAPPPT